MTDQEEPEFTLKKKYLIKAPGVIVESEKLYFMRDIDGGKSVQVFLVVEDQIEQLVPGKQSTWSVSEETQIFPDGAVAYTHIGDFSGKVVRVTEETIFGLGPCVYTLTKDLNCKDTY